MFIPREYNGQVGYSMIQLESVLPLADQGEGPGPGPGLGSPPPPPTPLFRVKNKEIIEARKASKASKTKLGSPPPPLAQGLDSPLVA